MVYDYSFRSESTRPLSESYRRRPLLYAKALSLVYFDIIAIFLKFVAHHIERVRHVLRLLGEVVVSLKQKQRKFYIETRV